MIEVTVDASEVKRLADLLERSPAVIKSAKKEAIAEAASKMKAIVDQEIGGTGKVKSWQGRYVGSKGLYAAVRPKAKTFAENRKGQPTRYAVGYVTNAINSGHRFPSPSGRKGYKPRIKSGKMNVSGKLFYQRASIRLGEIAEDAATSVCLAVTSHLTGEKTAAVPQTTPHAGSFQPFTRIIGGKVYTFRPG